MAMGNVFAQKNNSVLQTGSRTVEVSFSVIYMTTCNLLAGAYFSYLQPDALCMLQNGERLVGCSLRTHSSSAPLIVQPSV